MTAMIQPGLKVKVYYNLHRKCLSVQDAKTRLVIAHVPEIALEWAAFKVSEAGRQRVLREKKKNVHAFVLGIVAEPIFGSNAYPDTVTYNPYKYESFVRIRDDRATPVTCAAAVHIKGRSIIANCAV
jgi:hypothetical protein